MPPHSITLSFSGREFFSTRFSRIMHIRLYIAAAAIPMTHITVNTAAHICMGFTEFILLSCGAGSGNVTVSAEAGEVGIPVSITGEAENAVSGAIKSMVCPEAEAGFIILKILIADDTENGHISRIIGIAHSI